MNLAYAAGLGSLALSLVATGAQGDHEVLISEVLRGCGLPSAQFVELTYSSERSDWAGCLRLEFFGGDGVMVGEFEFSENPAAPLPLNKALVATEQFAELPFAPPPDFIMPQLVMPAGSVCVRDTGQPHCLPNAACVSYGGPGGPPALRLDGASIQRIPGVLGVHEDDEFQLGLPSPTNAAGQGAGMLCTGSEVVKLGAHIFFEETFEGNGRTCGTCHPEAHAFTIGPSVVAALPPSDPLFVAETEPALEALERTTLLRGPRTLVLENVDGFERPPVFRGTAHLLNVGKTAPYGLMGDVPDLQTFAAMAVRQHFPRSLARIPGVDFREPRHFELAALEAFMQSIFAGDQSGLNPWQLVLGPAADRGRALFLGAARCSVCHGGWFLSTPKPVVFPPRFDTGVARQPINLVSPPGFPECPPIGPLEEGRLFDVPTLVGVRDTAPFFHDNSAATLREAVAFYSSESFNQSPAAAIVGTIALSPEEIDDLTAFLESLTACGNGVLDRGERCDDGNVQDGDCCSATCGTAAEDGIACDDGDACTTTKCRRGDCVVAEEPEACNQYGLVSDDEELLHPCSGADTLSPAVVACPIAFLPRDVSCKGGRGIQRRLDRGLALVEKALSVDPSRAARKMLGEAVHAFARARRLANTSASPGCDSVFGTAAAEAENRTKCLRKCIAERLDR